jgi:hypothetical protein
MQESDVQQAQDQLRIALGYKQHLRIAHELLSHARKHQCFALETLVPAIRKTY